MQLPVISILFVFNAFFQLSYALYNSFDYNISSVFIYVCHVQHIQRPFAFEELIAFICKKIFKFLFGKKGYLVCKFKQHKMTAVHEKTIYAKLEAIKDVRYIIHLYD